jgi:hypothetical protein
MPKLLLFVPCERVILGQGDNSVSLIVLIKKLQLNQLEGMPLQESTTVFARLSLFAEWKAMPEDADKMFEQRFTLGGVGIKQALLETVMEFKMVGKTQRTIGIMDGFPVLPAGEYEFAVWLREKGAKWPDAPVATYPVDVAHASGVTVHK